MMNKAELLDEIKNVLSDVMEQVAFARSGMESSDDTIIYAQEACENSYRRIFGSDYVYEDDRDTEEADVA